MDKNSIIIQEFMLEFGLNSTELIVFAVIFECSQGFFNENRSYLAMWAACSIKTIDRILKNLQDKGLIKKGFFEKNGQKLPYYQAVQPEMTQTAQSENSFSLSGIKVDEKLELRRRTWEAFEKSYIERYGVRPLRNAKNNKIIARICEQVGSDSPDLCSFYVQHNDNWFLLKKHDIAQLLCSLQQVYTDFKASTLTTKYRVDKWVREQDMLLKKETQAERLIKRIQEQNLLCIGEKNV